MLGRVFKLSDLLSGIAVGVFKHRNELFVPDILKPPVKVANGWEVLAPLTPPPVVQRSHIDLEWANDISMMPFFRSQGEEPGPQKIQGCLEDGIRVRHSWCLLRQAHPSLLREMGHGNSELW